MKKIYMAILVFAAALALSGCETEKGRRTAPRDGAPTRVMAQADDNHDHAGHAGHDHEGEAEHSHDHGAPSYLNAGSDDRQDDSHDHDAHRDGDSDTGHDHGRPSYLDTGASGDVPDTGHDHDGHAGHGHGAMPDMGAAEDGHGDHAGHDHGSGDGHAHAHEEADACLLLTPEQIERYQIETYVVQEGALTSSLAVPGEIKMNRDRLARISPIVEGVAREIYVEVGDEVKEGDPLVLIDSRELGDLKADFLAARARKALAEQNHARELSLYRKKITAEQDYQLARRELSEAQALYLAARQKLMAVGISAPDLDSLSGGGDERFSALLVRAPLSGVVIMKDVALMEHVAGDARIFEVADLSTVWVDLRLTQEQAPQAKVGQSVYITPSARITPRNGKISYVSPFVDPGNRTALARIVLDNPGLLYRPGTFVEGVIQLDSAGGILLAPLSSIQYVDDVPSVFLKTSGGFERKEVVLGQSDKDQVEIIGGLSSGDEIVINNAFCLKTEFEKRQAGADDPHAGHMH